MPVVDGEHFAYNKAGYKAAAKKRLKKGKGKRGEEHAEMMKAMRHIAPPPARK